jgi:hypothetical protein
VVVVTGSPSIAYCTFSVASHSVAASVADFVSIVSDEGGVGATVVLSDSVVTVVASVDVVGNSAVLSASG